jgi:glutamyl endopeptidase
MKLSSAGAVWRGPLLPVVMVVAFLAIGWASEPGHPADASGGRSYHDASAPAGRAPGAPRDATGTKQRSVIGTDDRVRINDTTIYPFSAVAYLELRDAENDVLGTCTATFIGADVLITAGHCLWDPEAGDWRVEHVRVVPGKDGSDEPFGSEFATDWWVPDAYAVDGSLDWDWGIIRLADDLLTLDTGWLPIAVLSTTTLQQGGFDPAIVGYPAEMPGATMWGSVKPFFNDVQTARLFYDIDTTPGQSGSAVWSLADGPTLGYIVGVHTQGTGAGSLNSGSRIDQKFLDDVLEACRVMSCTVEYYVEGGSPAPQPSRPFRAIGAQLSRD